MFSAHIQGIAGGNAETRQAGQTSVTSVSIAVDQSYYSRERKERVKKDPDTVWVRLQAFDGYKADLMSLVQKGQIVDATGNFEVVAYTDKNGAHRLSYQMTVTSIAIVPKRPQNGQNSPLAAPASAAAYQAPQPQGQSEGWPAANSYIGQTDPWGVPADAENIEF
ncbi:single-stranded DNA-binding protein [Alloscardovia macacae]|uniref:Single-stranded DNA-binding protein n=1 Tax=Alloscardovia macacae TaxID=1160091 RepID=A0A261F2E0_9BIFI|nr:single-stranded DNA-binding protein [Alloscardovia macacae]OZG53086.1 hypothetical protein ALMA_1388 [Alloscardovia macacae]